MIHNRQYNLQFGKSARQGQEINYMVSVKEGGSVDLANFLMGSNFEETEQQIAKLPDEGDVKVGDTILPNTDFKAILQEWLQHIHPRTVEFEKAKLIKYLGLPLTNVVFDERYQMGEYHNDENFEHIKATAKLYYHDHFIGDYEYMNSPFGIMYNRDYDVAKWTRGVDVFRNELLAQIQELEPLAADIAVRSYETLFVKNADQQNIKIAYCRFNEGWWQIHTSGLDVTEHRVELTVTLPVPKFDI